MRILLIVVPLIAMLVLAVWAGWDLVSGLVGGDMSPAGWAAAIIGAVLTIALGGGLMALVFYSSRRGYDDRVEEATHGVSAPESREQP
jgi:membrane associated rhomboid family serine protease